MYSDNTVYITFHILNQSKFVSEDNEVNERYYRIQKIGEQFDFWQLSSGNFSHHAIEICNVYRNLL